MRGSSRSMSSRQPVTGTPRDTGETIGSPPRSTSGPSCLGDNAEIIGPGAGRSRVSCSRDLLLRHRHQLIPDASRHPMRAALRRLCVVTDARDAAALAPADIGLARAVVLRGIDGGSRYRPRRPRKRALVAGEQPSVINGTRAGTPDPTHPPSRARRNQREHPEKVRLLIVILAADTGGHARTRR